MNRVKSSVMLLLAALVANPATATTVTETFIGKISGANTIDTDGIFGPVGDNLSGRRITVRIRYVTTLLTTMSRCRINPTTCSYDATQQRSPAAVELSYAIGAVTAVYSSDIYGDVIFDNTTQNRFVPEANVFSGQSQGGRGSAINVSFKSPVVFGKQLSPSNQAVVARSDLLSFFKAGDAYASEVLTVVIEKSSR